LPEDLAVMGKAFEEAVSALGIGHDEKKREAAARFVIQFVQSGGSLDMATLRDKTIAEFSGPKIRHSDTT
jgi:hypothetical protein